MEQDCIYRVQRAPRRIVPDCGWDREEWAGVPSLAIGRHMGDAPSHRPRVQAKLRYDDECVSVIFRVEDRYVRSVVVDSQGPVCTDSCVEFFFTPGADIGQGYYNIETNCGGTALFMHQKAGGKECIPLSDSDIAALAIAHTLPHIVDPEIEGPVCWHVAYRVPYAILRKYAPVATPAPGVAWRANLYKCADRTSHPHWLTWAPVGVPRPDFHRPEFFGILEFTA